MQDFARRDYEHKMKTTFALNEKAILFQPVLNIYSINKKKPVSLKPLSIKFNHVSNWTFFSLMLYELEDNLIYTCILFNMYMSHIWMFTSSSSFYILFCERLSLFKHDSFHQTLFTWIPALCFEVSTADWELYICQKSLLPIVTEPR